VIHDGIPYDLIQGQGHGGLQVAKMADFKVSNLPSYEQLTHSPVLICKYLQFYALLSEQNCVMMTCALIQAVVWLQIANLLTTFKSLFLSVTSEAQHLINFVDEYVVCEDMNVLCECMICEDAIFILLL